jgi:hypothetical protein
MIALSLLLIASTAQHKLEFPGGDPSDLCRLIDQKVGVAASCLVYDDKPIQPFVLKWLELKDFDRLMRPVGKHHLSRGVKWMALYRGGLPSIISAMDGRYLDKIKPFVIPDEAEKDGKFSLRTGKGTALRVASLGRLNFSKPLKVHWLYRNLGVAVSATETSEVQLLSSIASAVGAGFKSSAEGFELVFDPKAYRSRYLETYRAPAPIGYPQYSWGKRYSIAQTNLGVETMRAITDAQLSKAFEVSNGSVSFPIAKDTPLHRAALKKIDAVEEASREKHPNFRQLADAYLTLLHRADLSGPFRVMFAPPAQVGVLVPDGSNPGAYLVF